MGALDFRLTSGAYVANFDDPACPLRLGDTPSGLGGAEADFYDIEGAGQDGVTFLAMMNKPNLIGCKVRFGPLLNDEPIKGDYAVSLYTAWRDAIGRGKRISRFTAVNSGRFQDVRVVPSSLPPMNLRDVYNVGFCEELITFRSDESWWRRHPLEYEFTAAEFAGAEIENHGDVESWAWFEFTGPITNPVLGVGDEAITIPLTVASGEKLTINTDRDLFEVTDNAGVDRAWIGDRWRQKVSTSEDAGGPVSLNVSGSGTSGVTRLKVIVPQLYERAI